MNKQECSVNSETLRVCGGTGSRTSEFCVLSEKSIKVTRGEVPTPPQLPGSPSSSSTCPRPGAPAKLLPWTRISSTPTALLPAASTVRHATWWRTVTVAWCTCQVRPQSSRHDLGAPQPAWPLTSSPRISASCQHGSKIHWLLPTPVLAPFHTPMVLSLSPQFLPVPTEMCRKGSRRDGLCGGSPSGHTGGWLVCPPAHSHLPVSRLLVAPSSQDPLISVLHHCLFSSVRGRPVLHSRTVQGVCGPCFR